MHSLEIIKAMNRAENPLILVHEEKYYPGTPKPKPASEHVANQVVEAYKALS